MNNGHGYSFQEPLDFEDGLHPDAKYWREGAEDARDALQKLTGKASDLTDEFWHDENTWKSICKQTEALLSAAQNVTVDTTAAPLNLTAHFDTDADLAEWRDERDTIADILAGTR